MLKVRWMIAADLDRVVRIEAASFPHPMTQEEIREMLRQRNCIGKVADDNGVCGYMIYTLQRRQLVLASIAVSPECRRLGYGEAMVAELKRKLIGERREIVALTSERNTEALLFLRAMGFVGRLVRRPWGSVEDDGVSMSYTAFADVC